MLPLRFLQKQGSWLKTVSICSCNTNNTIVESKRGHRSRPTHNIGRLHGIVQEKKLQLAISDARSRKSECFILDEFEDLMSSTKMSLLTQEGLDLDAEYQASETHYGVLNFIVSGYDMSLVENFAGFVHRTMIKYNQDIIEVYALPTHDVLVKDATSNTNDLEKMINKLTLQHYRRVVQIRNMEAITYPILLQILMHVVPQAVTLEIKEHSEEQVRERLQRSTELDKEKEALMKLETAK